MVCMMVSKSSPTLLRRQLGAELRRLRSRVGRTVADVAAELGWSESKLSRIETASTGIRNADLQRLFGVYHVEEIDRARLVSLAGQARQRGWWEAYTDVLPNAYESYIGFEAEASSIFTYEAQVVPGLLQTAEYANAVLHAGGVYSEPSTSSDPGVTDQRIAVRLARQAVLIHEPPPTYRAVLDEAVLRRPVGGADVQRRQMLRLVEASERRGITIQVLPFSAGAHPALHGSFILLEFAGSEERPLVYSEGMTGGVFRTRPEELETYRATFEALRTAALQAEESVAFIKTLANGGA
jgi:transcriptional regulator with XRE-family HTH domain